MVHLTRTGEESPMTFTLTPSQIDDITRQLGIPDHEIRWAYSGRAMYDQTCFGYTGTGKLPALALLLAASIAGDGDTFDLGSALDALADLGEPRTDSLGLGAITYWPNVRIAVHA